ncbi:MAG: hypothetical protein GXP24_01880 [Planctomycetes bacterium]|nr:hypothetical protein [Planctomycetota bacterium]
MSTSRTIWRDKLPWSATVRRALVIPLAIPLMILMLATAGCGGCDSKQTPQTQAEKEEAEKEKKNLAAKKKRDDREIKPLLPLLGQEPSPENNASELPTGNAGHKLLVKPGHWTTTVQEMKSNYEDFVGDSSAMLLDSKRQPVTLDHTNFTFQSKRPVALAKGRKKRVEGELYIPEQSTGVQLRATLRNRHSGGLEKNVPQPMLQKMPSYQYFIVVLSKEISQYGFLKVTDAVRMPWEEEFDAVSQPHYRVVLADASKSLPLPSNALTWTSVSHLFWDEVDPTRLTPAQQLALVDWLHWGGRLIINGPDSLDTLRGSFLADFLPVEIAGPRAVTKADLNEWSAYWSRRDRGTRPPQLQPTKPWSGIRLKPNADATELAGGAELFYEQFVGRGTVVVSAIQLAERDLINWPGYDSFLNAALLRRPRRLFSKAPYDDDRPRIGWSEYPDRRLDAHFTTGLRMFARDAKMPTNQWSVEEPEGNLFGQSNSVTTTKIDRPGGIGSWSEFNPVSEAARAVLTDAAAVRVPGGGFVLACLGFYLVVLVPLNWMVFRTLGRVEWAWIAAPVIAVLGTLLIVRLAQLDIGFVRSQTEVALLELQETHPRGLLSRFTALYSSLSTTYDVTFDSPTTVATPFPASKKPRPIDENIWDVVFEKQNETRLRGLAVSSASTKMVHSEEMFALAGSLRLGRSSRGHEQLVNRLGYSLRDVVVVRRFFERGSTPKYESSWIGELRDGDSAVIGFRPLAITKDQIPHLEERQQATSVNRATKMDVEPLLKVAFDFPGNEDPVEYRRDECRVVGLIDQVLPGSTVSPAASQIVGATVVLAHLEFGNLSRPEPDVNSRSDVIEVKAED